MNQIPRVVILTTKGGQGLISGSHALREALFAATNGNVDPEIIDFFETYSPTGSWLTSVYNYLLRHSLRLNALYIRLLHRIRADRWKFFHKKPIAGLRRLLAEKKPDILVLTSQYIVACVANGLKELRPSVFCCVGNIDPGTSCVPLWFDDNIDLHLIPSPEAMRAYLNHGFDPKRAVLTKLNVRQRFLEAFARPKEEIREELGWSADEFVVLFAGSREGYFGIIPIIRQLTSLKDLRLVVICGKNQALRAKLEVITKSAEIKLEALGWRDDVHYLMRAADVVVAKPGKQTMKETLAVAVPLIAIDFPAVMEQEKGNLEYLENRGVLIRGRSPQGVVESILSLKDNTKLRLDLSEKLNAARLGVNPSEVADTILKAFGRRNEGQNG